MMNKKSVVLVVEDDAFAAAFAVEILALDYEVRHVDNGAAALVAVAKGGIDLVLLDVEMPEMNGYQVCRALRENSAISDLPILFLSAKVNDDERLAGYEAGGDDYLTKPVSGDELRSKIRLALTHFREKKQLKTDLSGAFSTAMTAMTSAAEIGIVLQFLRTSFSLPDYASLCQEVIKTLASYGLDSSVKVHGQEGSVSFSPSGRCSPLEDSVLTNLSKQGRMFEFGSRTSCSYPHITIIFKNDPKEDPDRHGRMKDNLAYLAEGADARISALDAESSVKKQHAALAKLAENTTAALQFIEQLQRRQREESARIFDSLRQRFDRSILTIGLTTSQEEELDTHLSDAAKCSEDLNVEALAIAEKLNEILQQLEQAK